MREEIRNAPRSNREWRLLAEKTTSENAELRKALAETVADLSDWLVECGSPGSPGNKKTIRVIDSARALLAKVEGNED